MKALILAAGLGSRLRNNTKKIPKALVEVNDKPIIEYQISALKNNGINELIVVLGKFGNSIKTYLMDNNRDIKITFVYNEIYDQSNSSYSFWLARDYIKDQEFIHLNCDIIFSSKLLGKIIQDKRSNLIATRTDLLLSSEMENVIINNGKIIRMMKKLDKNSMGKAFGLAKFNNDSTEKIIERIEGYINNGDYNQHCYGMIRELVQELDYFSFIANDEILLEVNTEKDLKMANQLLKSNSILNN